MTDKKKVIVKSYRGIRNDAHCEDCDLAWNIRDKDSLNDIRSHVRKTGHTVVRVYGSEFVYSLEG